MSELILPSGAYAERVYQRSDFVNLYLGSTVRTIVLDLTKCL
jgi:hypothetical protein